MSTKPRHLTTENASRFQDQSLVDVYHTRLPYPQTVYDRLLSLLTDLPRVVLDAGTGTGDLARGLVPFVERVDALDISEAMIQRGQMMTNGQHPHLNWIHGRVEEVHLQAPYSLIIGGDSIHWMEWNNVFPMFQRLLHPDGYVVIIERGELSTAWNAEIGKLIAEFSVYKNFERYDLIDELEKRSLFQVVGREITAPVVSTQAIDDYVASFHSRGSLSPEAMTADAVKNFDARLRLLVEPYAKERKLELETEATIVWGKPLR